MLLREVNMDNFLKYWFGGFDASLSHIDETSRNKIFKECGKACSNSYTRQVFMDAKKEAHDDKDFFAALKKTFTELELEIKEANLYEISYKFCACDLVRSGFVSSPYLCECSRSSLEYNLESVWGEGQAEVTLIESILAGAPCCRFLVKHRTGEEEKA